MTQEEKARRYDEALEMARSYYNNEETRVGMTPIDLEAIFPELKEWEDEKAMKDLLNFLKSPFIKDNICDWKVAPWIAWLEKQGRQKSVWHNEDEEPQRDSLILLIMQSGTPIVAKIIEPNHTFNHGERWAYIDDLLEKQGEQKPNPYTGTSFEYNGHNWGMCARDNGIEILFDGELKAFLSSEKSFIYPIHPQPYLAPKSASKPIKEKKVDNQNCIKSIDNVEPKFKVGDWILYSGDHYEGVRHITKINENGYYIERNGLPHGIIPFNHEICMRLWTIQDAKDGDVLAEDSCIFIIQKLGDNSTAAKTYCTLYDDGDFDDGTILYFDIDSTKPATKEQCDLLFRKMHEAGYGWDAEKKELKKFHVIDECKDEMDYCFTKMMNGEKVSSAWSEVDAFRTSALIDVVKSGGSIRPELRNEFVDWLESLKERYTWKPTDEQMDELENEYLKSIPKY